MYDDGVYTVYNVAAARSSVYHSRFGTAVYIVQGMKHLQAYSRWILPIKLIIRTETNFVIIAFEENKNPLVLETILANQAVVVQKRIVNNAKSQETS